MTASSTVESKPRQSDASPEEWVRLHGDALFRYALAKVHRAEVAEDLVQETFLAAWRGRERYTGGASVRTWLTAILKRKTIDWLRRAIAERKQAKRLEPDDWLNTQFTHSGKWRTKPAEWLTDHSEREEFWSVLHGCVGKLPPRLRDVFSLWHLEESDGPAICRTIGITSTNLAVMLFRARQRMWRCLSKNWYGLEPEGHDAP
jgi:RNA polymerase sigma-70 factor (ECF subfamily)